MAVGTDSADDFGFVGGELCGVCAGVGGEGEDGLVAVGVVDLDAAVPRRGEESVLGDEIPVDGEDFAAVLGPGLDGELRDGYVEEFDGPVAGGCDYLVLM